jgi:hypothetical protein
MLPEPEIGQFVRLENHNERLIIKSVSSDGGKVDLISETDPAYQIKDVPCLDLLLAENYSAES